MSGGRERVQAWAPQQSVGRACCPGPGRGGGEEGQGWLVKAGGQVESREGVGTVLGMRRRR